MNWILQPWPWYVAGPMIALTMFLMLWFGKNFGVSSNFRTVCAIGGGARISSFFDFDWRSQIWNLIFVLGTVIGGHIAGQYLTKTQTLELGARTESSLRDLGWRRAGEQYLPPQIFGDQNGLDGYQIALLIVGGLLVGFGARYAGGCTSGHAISGLSNLQIPSLIAVIGFFVGGLAMVHLIMPFIV